MKNKYLICKKIMCSRFIEDFTNKVIEKSCCESCCMKKKLCLGPNDFNYLNKSLCYMVEKRRNISVEEIPNYVDLMLSSIHNGQYTIFIEFLKVFSQTNNIQLLRDLRKKIMNHMICITDTKEVVSASFGDWKDLHYIEIDKYFSRIKISFKEWLIIYFKI